VGVHAMTDYRASCGREGGLQTAKPSASDWVFFADTAGQMAEAARLVGDIKLAERCQLLGEAMRRHETLTRSPHLKLPDPIVTDELSQLSVLLTAVTETARSEDYELYKLLVEAGNALGTSVLRARYQVQNRRSTQT
jgi:hypothetical protein